MNKIIRLWNQNRKKFIMIILSVVFLIVIIQIFNQMARNNKKNKSTVSNIINTEVALPTQSIMSDKKVSEEVTKTNVNVIDSFINYCNNGNVDEAYNLLSDKCKEILFPTQEIFKSNYYDVIFSERRMYNIQNWISSSKWNTYLVDFYNDVMSTGKVEETIAFRDYITVDSNNTDNININSFIRYDELNRNFENEMLKVNIIGKQIYKDYEIYKIKIQNKTDNTFLLDSRRKY